MSAGGPEPLWGGRRKGHGPVHTAPSTPSKAECLRPFVSHLVRWIPVELLLVLRSHTTSAASSVRECSIPRQVCGGRAAGPPCLPCKRAGPGLVFVVDGGASSLASETHTRRTCRGGRVPRQSQRTLTKPRLTRLLPPFLEITVFPWRLFPLLCGPLQTVQRLLR